MKTMNVRHSTTEFFLPAFIKILSETEYFITSKHRWLEILFVNIEFILLMLDLLRTKFILKLKTFYS